MSITELSCLFLFVLTQDSILEMIAGSLIAFDQPWVEDAFAQGLEAASFTDDASHAPKFNPLAQVPLQSC
jgi:hypothetical protein